MNKNQKSLATLMHQVQSKVVGIKDAPKNWNLVGAFTSQMSAQVHAQEQSNKHLALEYRVVSESGVVDTFYQGKIK
jgi:hypothetical protein